METVDRCPIKRYHCKSVIKRIILRMEKGGYLVGRQRT